MDYLRVKNWEKYQHRDALRGVGPMPWVRIQTSIMSDDKVMKMTHHQRYLWIGMLLLCGQTRNRVSTTCDQLGHLLGMRRSPNIQFMWDMGLIEACDASSLPAREEKRREEKQPVVDSITHEQKVRRQAAELKKLIGKIG